MCHKLKEIQQCFENYYKDLYSQPDSPESPSIINFLNSLDLPSIGTEQNRMMTCEITKQELDSKMSGAGGYPAEWYKTFREMLSPILLKCFNFTMKGGEIPISCRQAIISVIPKIGKAKSDCSSYRPISILNIDYKL